MLSEEVSDILCFFHQTSFQQFLKKKKKWSVLRSGYGSCSKSSDVK